MNPVASTTEALLRIGIKEAGTPTFNSVRNACASVRQVPAPRLNGLAPRPNQTSKPSAATAFDNKVLAAAPFTPRAGSGPYPNTSAGQSRRWMQVVATRALEAATMSPIPRAMAARMLTDQMID